MRLLRLIGLWGPVVAFMVVVFALSSPARVPTAPAQWDKLLHAVAYGLFAVLCLRATHGGLRELRVVPVLAALALTLVYAMFDELHQRRIPGRHASVWDWVADATGAAAATWFVGRWFGLRARVSGIGETAGGRNGS